MVRFFSKIYFVATVNEISAFPFQYACHCCRSWIYIDFILPFCCKCVSALRACMVDSSESLTHEVILFVNKVIFIVPWHIVYLLWSYLSKTFQALYWIEWREWSSLSCSWCSWKWFDLFSIHRDVDYELFIYRLYYV